MEDSMDYLENKKEKKILSKGSSCDACLVFTPRQRLRSNIPMNPQNKDSTKMVVCPAPRHSEALTPQAVVLMTDVRICLISEDGS